MEVPKETDQQECPGCHLKYPDRLLDRIVNLTTSRICPLCALYILRDIHGQDYDFKGSQNRGNFIEAKKIANGKWKAPTEVA